MLPFFVWQNKVLKHVRPEEVMFLIAEKNYTKIFLANKTYYLVRSNLSIALESLPPDIFIQIHRSYAVSIHYLDEISRDHVVVGETPIPIGKLYYRGLIDRLNIIE